MIRIEAWLHVYNNVQYIPLGFMPDLFTLLNNFYNHFGSYCETLLYTLDAKRLEAT